MTLRIFTHLYDTYEEAVNTVQALEAAGIVHNNISVVANNADSRHVSNSMVHHDDAEKDSGTGAVIGTAIGGGAGLLAGLGMLAIPGVGPVVAAGWLVATIVGAGVGAGAGAAGGGLLGTLTHAGVPEDQAHTYAEGVRRGGTLVTVKADDASSTTIENVLNGRSTLAVDVNARRTSYQSEGWTAHDVSAGPYTADPITADKISQSSVSAKSN